MDKEYIFQFESFNKIFSKKDAKEQMEFCRQVKEGWNDALQQVYREVVRTYYKKLAIETQSFEELCYYRVALKMFQKLEIEIKKFSDFHSEKLKSLTQPSQVSKI